LGEKWVSNKWIREFSQEFRRPCLLDPNVWRTVLNASPPTLWINLHVLRRTFWCEHTRCIFCI
jgi:hypothetical protein